MSQHFIVTADHGHLRIYEDRRPPGQQSPALDQVEALDFPLGRQAYTDRDSDMAGRFPSSKGQSAGAGSPIMGRGGMSIDERMPMQREEARRRVNEIASVIDHFLQQRPDAQWDFAAGPDLNNALLEQLSGDVRQRLRRTVSKDLVNHRADEVRAHFAGI